MVDQSLDMELCGLDMELCGLTHVCTIVPASVFERLAENDNAEIRAAAVSTLRADSAGRLTRASAHLLNLQATAVWPAIGPFRKNVRIFDAQNGSNLPGTFVRGEGDPA